MSEETEAHEGAVAKQRDEPDSRHEIVVASLRNKSNEDLQEMIR